MGKGVIVERNQPCSCGSSDARQVYDDGWSYCFSCLKSYPTDKVKVEREYELDTTSLKDIKQLPSRGFRERGITKAISEFYGVKVSYNLDGDIEEHYYPYDNGTAYKIRKLPKEFRSTGKIKGLFGKDKFNGGKRIVITEGELDAMAIQQAYYEKYNSFYPVVSVRSASTMKDLIEERTWLRQFDEVVIWFDNDDAGKVAAAEAAKIIGYDRVKLAKSTEKDASDTFIKHGGKSTLATIYDAQDYSPAGILVGEQIWDQLVAYNEVESVPFPEAFDGLNDKLKGIRTGEITLLTSGSGCGKSSIIREWAWHLKQNTNDKIGIVALEESPAETARKMSGLALNKNPAAEEIDINELREGFDKVFRDHRVLVLDHQGASSDSAILDHLEYLALVGCKYLFLDHITILVSEGAGHLEGNEAVDYTMNRLLSLVKKYDVHVFLISHLRKMQQSGKSFEEGIMPTLDDIRGAGSQKQIAMNVIAFSRHLSHENEQIRNTINLRVLKCRHSGLTGDSGAITYQFNTGRMHTAETTLAGEDFGLDI